MVVPTALFGASHSYFEMYWTAAPEEAVSAKLMETIPKEFSIELAKLERPSIVQYNHGLALTHDRGTVSILEYPS